MTGYAISEIIDRRIDLHQFDIRDWTYDPSFDVVFVREGSKIYTYLALALT
jgi:hypothetical protein